MADWRKLFAAHWIDLVDFCCSIGLISGAAIALALGKLLLALVLGAFALGAWLRFKRGRVARGKAA